VQVENAFWRDLMASSQISTAPVSAGSVSTDRSLVEETRSFAFTTKLEKLVAWGRKNSLWPMPYGTACCGIEFMSVMGPS
jgi:NADH-quinone oxidoreductase subunit B